MMTNGIRKKQKKNGTREEVFLGLALKTTGGLFQKDIIQKKLNNKIIYVSRKLSTIAKERDVFSNYRKRRKTRALQPTKINITHNTNSSLLSNKMTKKNVSFSLNQNKYQSIYYPELEGKNLNTLRHYNDEDEEDEDTGYEDTGNEYTGNERANDNEIQHSPKQFNIQDIGELQL